MLTIWKEDDSCDFVAFFLVIGFRVEKRRRNGGSRTKASK